MARRILVLAPHTDDGELGCGGTMSRLLAEGAEIFYIAFSACEESVPAGFPRDALRHEVVKATAELGIPRENLTVLDYPVRRFNEHRQAILEDLVGLRAKLSPDVVFMPCEHALHQDHHAIYSEGLRAFKHYTCYGYDLPWDSVKFSSTAFFKLDEFHVKKKCDALAHYVTQRFRSYIDDDFIHSLARVRGAQIGTRYAEAFELIRVIY